MSEPAAVAAFDLHKSYHLGKTTLHVLRGVSFSVNKGEFLSIVGASGSGAAERCVRGLRVDRLHGAGTIKAFRVEF